MADILILGGTGYTGTKTARLLLAHSDVAVTIAARHLDRAQSFVDELNREFPGRRASAVYADAADAQSLKGALEGQDLVVVAAPTTAYTGNVARAALQAGVDYLDVQISAEKFSLLQSLAPEIERSGHCFVTEAGYHPGLPSVLVRCAADRLDTVESAVAAGYIQLEKNLPYTEAMDELVECFKDYPGQVFKKGQWTKRKSYDIRKFDFGGDIGNKLCYSMFLEEMRPLPGMYPSLKEVGFYVSESHWMVDYVVMPITWIWLMIMPRAVRPVGRFLWWGMTRFHNPPERVELQVHAAGTKDGRPAEARVGISHPDGYELTAIPVAAALLQYLDGSARKPGLWMMGHFVDPVRLMADMQRMGASVSVSGG